MVTNKILVALNQSELSQQIMSGVERIFTPGETELILYMMASTKKKSVKKAISHFITGLRNIKIAVNGKDIKKLGIEPGPIYRQILQAVLEAKLNEQLKTRKDELIFIRRYVSKF